jgi:hypothetical protein
VARGDEYEAFCAELLARKWGLQLSRSGGPHDRGVDAWGAWPGGDMHVFVQCKRFHKAMGVADVREFEAAVLRSGHASGLRFLGILCTASGLTAGAMRHLLGARVALVAVHVAFGDASPRSVVANVPAQSSIPSAMHASVLGVPA